MKIQCGIHCSPWGEYSFWGRNNDCHPLVFIPNLFTPYPYKPDVSLPVSTCKMWHCGTYHSIACSHSNLIQSIIIFNKNTNLCPTPFRTPHLPTAPPPPPIFNQFCVIFQGTCLISFLTSSICVTQKSKQV